METSLQKYSYRTQFRIFLTYTNYWYSTKKLCSKNNPESEDQVSPVLVLLVVDILWIPVLNPHTQHSVSVPVQERLLKPVAHELALSHGSVSYVLSPHVYICFSEVAVEVVVLVRQRHRLVLVDDQITLVLFLFPKLVQVGQIRFGQHRATYTPNGTKENAP